MKQILPLIASCVTVYNMYLAGNKDHRAWIFGLLNQIVWLAFIISFGAWGLLPLTIVLTFMYFRNLRKWKHEAATTKMTSKKYDLIMADLDSVEGQ